MSKKELADKVAIVTGAGGGIGKAYALGLYSRGAKVIIAEIDAQAGETTSKELDPNNSSVIAIETDVSNEASVSEMVDETIQRFGRIDILVNNAGLFVTLFPGKPFHEISVEEWDQVMAVNVRGSFLCAKAVYPQMKSQGCGSIINISSGVYYAGIPNWLHYVSSKSAIVGMTRGLAKELGPYGIRVNTITPGFTVSEGVKVRYDPAKIEHYANLRCLARPEEPEDLVGAVAFLSSEESKFITGQIINVDGGMHFH